jgi:NAD(P)H-dependent FMN reductase
MTNIKIVTGSTRPGRFNIQPANWILELAKKRADILVELVDLEKLNLPFLDEPVPPKMNKYTQDHTKIWSKTVAETDGFVFVTPEYNHSYSAALKNALDYVFYEWNYKPVTFMSYGSEAGGSRAVEHLRGVAAELKMFDLSEQVLLPNYWEHTNEKGEYQFIERNVKAGEDMLDALVFWATEMKESRARLKSL